MSRRGRSAASRPNDNGRHEIATPRASADNAAVVAGPHRAAFVDSHAHLADPSFADDADAVVERARTGGGRAIVCIGESIAAADRARALATHHAGFVFFTAGHHPHDAASFDAHRDIPAIRRFILSGAVAVGECGLDYHYDHSPRDAQLRAFRAQLELAAETRRPVVVHTRDAEDDTAVLVSEAGQAGVIGVLHCFTGSRQLAERALDAGWYISFSGIVTFRTWTDDEVIRLVPPDRLLAESDAPYLAPVPHRGKRNEPAYVGLTVARIAAARGDDLDTVSHHVTRNAVNLFGLAGVRGDRL